MPTTGLAASDSVAVTASRPTSLVTHVPAPPNARNAVVAQGGTRVAPAPAGVFVPAGTAGAAALSPGAKVEKNGDLPALVAQLAPASPGTGGPSPSSSRRTSAQQVLTGRRPETGAALPLTGADAWRTIAFGIVLLAVGACGLQRAHHRRPS
jgi:hypothetical protein